ncbi:MAG: hypothetical protein U9R38_06450 [Candidatus Margulisiibacteriota bacterium]|nr:hypothetical protein [Candidatus Margulisiibacteriota bacterium]
MKKIVVLLVIGLLLSGIVFAMGEKPPKMDRTEIPQEWKTYVSKYGFSISYPSNWQLTPAVNAKSMEESERWAKEGYDSFSIYSPSNNSNAGLAIECFTDTDTVIQLSYKDISIPDDPAGRILFLAKESPFTIKYKKNMINNIEEIKVNGGQIYLVHDNTEFSGTTVLFYLEKKKFFCVLDAYYPSSTPNKEKEYKEIFIKIVKTMSIL